MKIKYKTLDEITSTINQRKRQKDFNYYSGDTHDI